ncbi:hypothetical protein PDESU_05790 [Pontiella desulfatans]|uniref:Uncharacterized protein n=1 Tax=Pontiella desulfatans TaxID=2750659 RepID=A0A6C2UCU4_PONDE|nr:hypothetical protein [Pontiella desulfatans]VGO17194.1 hypothetical protein PDESU_05790 [Pontiella desulfatans]
MDLEMQRVCECLQRNKTRATYGAVGEYTHTPHRSVSGRLGRKCPLASWVVRADTKKPKGYAPTQLDTDLESKPDIITTGDELGLLMRQDFEQQQQEEN